MTERLLASGENLRKWGDRAEEFGVREELLEETDADAPNTAAPGSRLRRACWRDAFAICREARCSMASRVLGSDLFVVRPLTLRIGLSSNRRFVCCPTAMTFL